MKVTLGGFLEFTGGTGFGRSRTESGVSGTGFGRSGTESGVSGTGSGISAKGADDGGVSTEGELLDLCCDGCRKVMLPNTQSINGL